MEIDYGKIVTNALSALVATVFVGAAVIVWNAATSIDTRIENANLDIKKQQGSIQEQQVSINEQQSSIQAAQKILVPEVAAIRTKVDDIENQLKSITQILSETEATKTRVSFDPNKYRDTARLDELIKEESNRINKAIDTRQMEFQKEK